MCCSAVWLGNSSAVATLEEAKPEAESSAVEGRRVQVHIWYTVVEAAVAVGAAHDSIEAVKIVLAGTSAAGMEASSWTGAGATDGRLIGWIAGGATTICCAVPYDPLVIPEFDSVIGIHSLRKASRLLLP